MRGSEGSRSEPGGGTGNDCQACTPECPVEAIFQDINVPSKWQHWIAINAERSAAIIAEESGLKRSPRFKVRVTTPSTCRADTRGCSTVTALAVMTIASSIPLALPLGQPQVPEHLRWRAVEALQRHVAHVLQVLHPFPRGIEPGGAEVPDQVEELRRGLQLGFRLGQVADLVADLLLLRLHQLVEPAAEAPLASASSQTSPSRICPNASRCES